jgi:hypothetical protein
LGISLLKKGYIAKYDFGRGFAVRQASVDAAIQVMQKLRDRFGDTQAAELADEGFRGNDKYLGKLVVFRKGPYVAGFVNLTEGPAGARAPQSLAAAIP